MPIIERSVPFRFRDAGENGDGLTLDGYAAVWDSPTLIDSWEGCFNEQIQQGAFRKSIRERTPILQFDHGRHNMIGSIPIGVINTLEEDDSGLHVIARMADNWLMQPVRDAIASQAINGMSFRFEVIRDKWTDANGNPITDLSQLQQMLMDPGEDGPLNRTLVEVKCAELGPVVWPAYQNTSIAVRARAVAHEIERDTGLRHFMLGELRSRTRDTDEPDEAQRAEFESALEELGLRADSKKPYGNVTYADPGYQKDGKKRYPLDTAEHVKAAWSYINVATNAAKYTSEQLGLIKGRIKSAAKKFGIVISESKSGADAFEQLPVRDIALALLFGDNVPDAPPEGHPSPEPPVNPTEDRTQSGEDAPLPGEHPSQESTLSTDRILRDAAYRAELLAIIAQGRDRYENA